MIPNSMAAPADGGIAGDCLEPFRRGTRNLLWLTVREGRRFILKGLPEALRSHPEEAARLRKEYSLGLRICHTGIVGTFGFEMHPEVGPVIVMEYVDGITLADYLWKNKSIPQKDRVGIARQIADALAYMHSMGVSHRDLKPDNIMVTRRNEAKIIDIGLGDSEDSVIYKQSLGTDGFGAPEQQSPCVGDSRADVYSFGRILEMLLPERKFRKLRKGCLKENPDKRLTMQDAVDILDSGHKPRKRGLWWWVLTCYGVMLVLGLAIGLFEELTGIKLDHHTPGDDTYMVSTADTVGASTVSVVDAGESDKGPNGWDILYEHTQMLDSAIAVYDVYFDRDRRAWKDSKEERNQKAHDIADHLLEELLAAGYKPMEADIYLSTYWEYVVDANKKMDEVMGHLKELQDQAQ